MKYFKIALFASIGWHMGKNLVNNVGQDLADYIKQSEWYRTSIHGKQEKIERPGDIKEVKNQIGFR